MNKKQIKNYKKTLWIIVIVCVICIIAATIAYGIFSGSSHESMKWAKNLSLEEVSCIEMVIYPQDMDRQYKVFSDGEMRDAISLINKSRGRYLANPEAVDGGGITLYLSMKDGSEHIVSNIGNLYLTIDGDHYDAGYDWLSSWPYTEGDSPVPCNFYGTSPVPEDYISFQAKVLERNDAGVIVEPLPGSSELDSADRFSIPLTKMPPSPEAAVGDVIEIQYNGEIMESYPAQLGEIYGTSVISESDQAGTDAMWDKIPMVRINGKLYYDTGKESTVNGRCGNMDGEITTTVDGTEVPTEDNQSNFGSGFGYQYGADDTIEIYMNEKWFVFECREE